MTDADPIRLVTVAVLPGGLGEPQWLLRLRAGGHAVATAASVQDILESGEAYDAIVFPAEVLANEPEQLRAAGESPLAPALVCLLRGGRTARDPLAGSGIHREAVGEDDPLQWDALLDRLLARKAILLSRDALGEELESMQTALERARQESHAFAVRASHEFQAAWRSVEQVLAGLPAAGLAPAQLQSLELLRDTAQRSQCLVRELLVLSQVALTPLQPARVDLAALVKAGIGEVDSAAQAMRWQVSPLPTVQGDETLLRLAIRAVLANAVKFTRRAASPCVEIACREGAAGITLQVSDNGVGLDGTQAHRLFQPLERLHAPGEFEGNGLGLALVKAVADRHGGKVGAHPRPGGGAVFTVWLPRAHLSPAASGPPQGARCSVLLVDDDELVLDTLARALERDGHLVSRARRAEEALAQLQQRSHDVLLSDWALPGLDGAVLAREARRLQPSIRTVLTSGRSGIAREPGVMAAHVDQVLEKPLSLATLRQVMAGPVGSCA